MSSRHFLLSVITLMGMIAGGCQPKPQQTPSQSSALAPIEAKPAATQPSTLAHQPAQDERPLITDSGGTADAVAQRANIYAKEMETLLAHRSASAERQDPTTRPAAEHIPPA